MRKFRKKPVEIEAIQWTGDNKKEMFDFLGYPGKMDENTTHITSAKFFWNSSNGLWIMTLEGQMHASINDYIIKGIKGEFYPCKPDIFRLTYDEVTE